MTCCMSVNAIKAHSKFFGGPVTALSEGLPIFGKTNPNFPNL